MKVLWAVLSEFPPLAMELDHKVPSSCGWLYSSAKALLKSFPSIELGVAVYSYGHSFDAREVEGVKYYLIPSKKMSAADNRQVMCCKKAITLFNPDIIHLHGTEHSLSLAMVKANHDQKPVLASIQGLASGIAPYSDGGLSFYDKLLNITPLDIFRKTSLFGVKRQMRSRAKCEEYVINHITDIAGRTQWDHDHTVSINSSIKYHTLNEALRDSFYSSPKWQITKCELHSIFVSNNSSPLKGTHQIIKALPLILSKYPDVKVYICGLDVLSTSIKTRLHYQGYHLYLRKLIKRLNVQGCVFFLGVLDEQEMKDAFLRSNVYVLPSSIENSSNSLCEAQVLGVPSVASYCGGTPSLLTDQESGYLYRYEEYTQLAQIIIRLFDNNNFERICENEITIAERRHDRDSIVRSMCNIYNGIINGNQHD